MASPLRLKHVFAGAALLALALSSAFPAIAQKVGVNSAVNPDASGTPPGAAVRRLVLGQEVVYNEHVVTGPAGQTQILFLDESAMSVGPNADVTIDNFVYDPNTGNGRLAMSATKGVLRFVGGKLSKNEDAVAMRTPVGTIGVRGGVFLMTLARGGGLEVVFLYGKALAVTGTCGTAACMQTITRPGFAVSIAGPGAMPTPPAPAPPNLIASALAAFNGKTGRTGGSSNPPTETSVASSGISNTISGNVAASVQQAALNTPPPVQPQGINVGAVQSTLSVNTVAPQGDPTVAEAVRNPTPSGTPIGEQSEPVEPVEPVGIAISGGGKIAPADSNTGFSDQSDTSRFTFSGAISNGAATGTNPSGTVFTLSPLRQGETTQVTGTASTAQNPATGTAYLAPDSRFFFANLTAQGNSPDKIFVFGGTPLDQSFFAAQPNRQILAFSVQPDFTLGGSGTQTIPFLPSFAGGTQPNAVVSPLYVATQPNAAFGNFNPDSNPSGKSPFGLQASLAINGQGSSQISALSILTNAFATSSDTGNVVISGPLRATYLAGGNSLVTHVNSGIAPVSDANGNNLFGGAAIDGFVIDSNNFNSNLNFEQNSANAFTIGPGGTQTRYAFNQPVIAAQVPQGVGVNRPALSEQGFFGGIMTDSRPFQYVLTGSVSLQTNPTNSTLSAFFSGTDSFTYNTPGGSNVQTLTIPFGSQSGRNFARSAYIDSNIFAATESATQAVQIVPASGPTTTYPTSSSGVNTYPTAGLVTSATVPGAADSLFAAGGATMCACQYLQWGYWEANLPTISGGTPPSNRTQTSYINTWLAGQLTPLVNLPASGTGIYNGAAIGTISNNGSVYLAAGQFNNTYNFGSQNGTISVSNLDGRSYGGSVTQTPGVNLYGGSLSQITGPGGAGAVAGPVVGSFFGPSANETGGTFALKNTSGTNYLASGIFAGKQ